MTILTLAGSPSKLSRSTALLNYVSSRVAGHGYELLHLSLRDVPAEDLIEGRYNSPAAKILRAKVELSSALIISTPVYKASYAGGLKAILDLLPEHALADRLVLPLATGGSPAHLLALEYGLKPVLSALGARSILAGIYASDAQVKVTEDNDPWIADDVRVRLDEATERLLEQLAILGYKRTAALSSPDIGELLLASRCSV